MPHQTKENQNNLSNLITNLISDMEKCADTVAEILGDAMPPTLNTLKSAVRFDNVKHNWDSYQQIHL